MENRYYIPTIEEFHIGFEYEMKERFGDGTVKTQEDYNNANWTKLTINSLNEIVYINRTLTGINSNNLPSAIRVKCLDKEDIESLGFICTGEAGNGYEKEFQKFNDDNTWYLLETSFDNEVHIELEIDKEDGRTINCILFIGTIKNKSELKTLLKQLRIK